MVKTCWSSSVVIGKTLYCNMVHLLEYSVIHVPSHVHMVCCIFLTLVVLWLLLRVLTGICSLWLKYGLSSLSSDLVSWKSSVAMPVGLSCIVFIAGKLCWNVLSFYPFHLNAAFGDWILMLKLQLSQSWLVRLTLQSCFSDVWWYVWQVYFWWACPVPLIQTIECNT
jgi:hypothetical protein